MMTEYISISRLSQKAKMQDKHSARLSQADKPRWYVRKSQLVGKTS